MHTSTTKRQLRLGAALLVAGLLPITLSVALADPSAIDVTTNPLRQEAASAASFQQQVVPYGDLDLDTAQGLEMLNRRLAMAAGNVCMHSDPRQLGGMREVRDCREQAMARAALEVLDLGRAQTFGQK